MLMKCRHYDGPAIFHLEHTPAGRRTGPRRHNVFLKHPHEAGETYLQHFRFTIGMAWRITLTGLILVIHGILPFLFTKTTSRRIAVINRIMQERLNKLGARDTERSDS